jgi:hypothetical protein
LWGASYFVAGAGAAAIHPLNTARSRVKKDRGEWGEAGVHFFVLILGIFSTLFCTLTLFCKNVYHFQRFSAHFLALSKFGDRGSGIQIKT